MNSYNFSESKSIEIFQPLCLRTGFLFQVVVFKKKRLQRDSEFFLTIFFNAMKG